MANTLNGNIDVTEPLSATIDDVIQINGEVTASRVYPIPTKLNDLADTDITNPMENQILKYNGSGWVNAFGGGGGGVTDYSELTSKPQINNVTLEGNKSLSDLGINIPVVDNTYSSTSYNAQSGNAVAMAVSTKLDASAEFIQSTSNDFDVSGHNLELSSAVSGKLADIDNKADKATTLSGYGISDAYTKTQVDDLVDDKITEPSTEGVAGQVLTTDGNGGRTWTTVSGGGGGTTDYNALNNKPSINGVSLTGNKSTADLGITIPDQLSDLLDDATHRLVTDTEKTTWNAKMDSADEYIQSTTSDFTVSGNQLALSSGVTNKLSSIDKLDLTSAASDDEVLAWDSTQNKYTPKVAKGGHDMLDSVSDVESLTDGSGNKVANAYVIKHYSNRYTNSVISTLIANNNEITIANDVFKDDNATFEFMFEPTQNASGTYEYLTLARYELDTTNGTLKITVVDAPTVDTRIRVDVTNYRA